MLIKCLCFDYNFLKNILKKHTSSSSPVIGAIKFPSGLGALGSNCLANEKSTFRKSKHIKLRYAFIKLLKRSRIV